MAETNETFGSGISTLVTKQLERRQELISKPNKTLDEIEALNSNVAWIRLRSSVNTLDDGDVKTLLELQKTPDKGFEGIGDPDDAKKFVLIGGTHSGNTARSGVNFEQTYDSSKAYNIDDRTGFRPMPGITSLKVSSKNTYGTLQVAEVNFNVWSLDDLETCEKLYFRPGYSAILEWGHTIVLDSNGNTFRYTGRDTGTGGIKDTDFFKTSKFSTLESSINSYREQSDGNYDGFIGYITNFSWSFRKDGGYDCSVKLVSKGAVLESVAAGKSTDAITDVGDESEKSKRSKKTVFHSFFEALEQQDDKAQYNGKAWLEQKIKPASAVKKLQPFQVFRYNTQIKNGGMFQFFDKDVNATYIKLRTFFDIFNEYVTIHNPKNKEKLVEFDIDAKEEYLTCKDHFTLDPLVAFPPKIPQTAPYKDYVLNIKQGRRRTNSIHSEAAGHVGAQKNQILNIMVSTHFLAQELDKVLDGPQEEGTGMMDAIKGILAGIQNAFGEVNDFDITTTLDESKFKVIDRNKINKKALPVISLTGLESTILDISLSSKISSRIASQVSIAAQGNAGNYKDNVAAILKWNAGAIDRHFQIKDSASKDDPKKSLAEQKQKYREDLTEAWNDYKGGDEYDGSIWNDLKGEGIAEMGDLIRKDNPDEPLGVVPVELSIKMLGISGLKVGSAFKIKPGLLPKKYDRFAYIVTGLEQEIGTDNKWITTVKTQFYSIK